VNKNGFEKIAGVFLLPAKGQAMRLVGRVGKESFAAHLRTDALLRQAYKKTNGQNIRPFAVRKKE
jgi:hypothetical protein